MRRGWILKKYESGSVQRIPNCLQTLIYVYLRLYLALAVQVVDYEHLVESGRAKRIADINELASTNEK